MTKPLAFVVEDDPQLSQIFAIVLSESFEVETIIDGDRAMARLQEAVPQLVVLDINLPRVSGGQILHFIRSDARLGSVRVILATADSRQAVELDDKADIVLLKPISIAQLRNLANRLK